MPNEKILIADDDNDLRELLASYLKEEGMKTHEASNGKDILPLIHTNDFDLIILDLMFDDADGFEILKEIRNNFPYLPVLILSARKEIYNKILGFGLGADDYITKPFIKEELIARIKANIRRSKILSKIPEKNQKQLSFESLKLDLKKYKLYKNEKEINLSSRHIKLLKFFMENPKQVFSKEQIYKNVWEDNYYDDNTVMVYIRNLRKLIEDDPDNPHFIKTVWGIGYKFLE